MGSPRHSAPMKNFAGRTNADFTAAQPPALDRAREDAFALTPAFSRCRSSSVGMAAMRVLIAAASSLTLIGAAPAFADSCPAVKELSAQILSCGHNSVAVERARECMHAVKEEAQAAVAELQRAAASRDRRALTAAIEKSSRRIELMKAQTDWAARYAEAMIDIPGSARKETSLDCFNARFDELQRLVTAMDNEIIRAKNARLRATRLSKAGF
jgi:hypothetical protein